MINLILVIRIRIKNSTNSEKMISLIMIKENIKRDMEIKDLIQNIMKNMDLNMINMEKKYIMIMKIKIGIDTMMKENMNLDMIKMDKWKLKKEWEDVADVTEYSQEDYYLLIDIFIKKIEYKLVLFVHFLRKCF